MNKTLCISILTAILSFCIGYLFNGITTSKKTRKEINAHVAYYRATETLLDTLDRNYDWVDGYDPQDYYQAKTAVDSLLGN